MADCKRVGQTGNLAIARITSPETMTLQVEVVLRFTGQRAAVARSPGNFDWPHLATGPGNHQLLEAKKAAEHVPFVRRHWLRHIQEAEESGFICMLQTPPRQLADRFESIKNDDDLLLLRLSRVVGHAREGADSDTRFYPRLVLGGKAEGVDLRRTELVGDVDDVVASRRDHRDIAFGPGAGQLCDQMNRIDAVGVVSDQAAVVLGDMLDKPAIRNFVAPGWQGQVVVEKTACELNGNAGLLKYRKGGRQ